MSLPIMSDLSGEVHFLKYFPVSAIYIININKSQQITCLLIILIEVCFVYPFLNDQDNTRVFYMFTCGLGIMFQKLLLHIAGILQVHCTNVSAVAAVRVTLRICFSDVHNFILHLKYSSISYICLNRANLCDSSSCKNDVRN